MTTSSSSRAAETVAAWATGVGMGLAALMVSWLIANRITALVWEVPLGPVVAMSLAIGIGVITTVFGGRRLAGSLNT
jgi:hypothetical protein